MSREVRREKSDGSGLSKLHLGCFDRVFPGWINTDITPHIFIARVPGLAWLLYRARMMSEQRYGQHKKGIFRAISYLDVTKKFPYPDSWFDAVYCSHLLEHLYPEQARFCLSEIYRVLKTGGIVRISVPDLDRIVSHYDPSHPERFLEQMFESRQKRAKNQHHWHYNEISLKQLFTGAGFLKIWRCGFKQGQCPDVALIDNRPELLI